MCMHIYRERERAPFRLLRPLSSGVYDDAKPKGTLIDPLNLGSPRLSTGFSPKPQKPKTPKAQNP